MQRLNEQQAKQIVFKAQMDSYPRRDIPELLAPLYEYIEQVEAESAELRKALSAACTFIAKTTCLPWPIFDRVGITWEEFFYRIARDGAGGENE